MLLGSPPPHRADPRCLSWDEPRWVVIKRSRVVQGVLLGIFLFYGIIPPLSGRPVGVSVVTGMMLVLIVVMTFFYRRRIVIDARGIWLAPMSPLGWLNPFAFLTIAGFHVSAPIEIKGVRLTAATANRPAEIVVSRKYGKPYAVVIDPSVSLATIQDALDRFGIATEREADQ